jgi:hypothetical protein
MRRHGSCVTASALRCWTREARFSLASLRLTRSTSAAWCAAGVAPYKGNKSMVVGAVERGGRIRVAVVEKGKPHAIRQFSSVAPSSRLCSKNQQHLRLALNRQRPDGGGEVGARLWLAGRPSGLFERARGSAPRWRADLRPPARRARGRGSPRAAGCPGGAVLRAAQGRVTAPSLADETSAAYFASTPLS